MARDAESSSGKRTRRGAVVVTALLVAASVPAAGTVAVADPHPSISDLKKQVEKLNDKAEKVTEKYNGGRVKLRKARAAKRSADRKLRKTNHALSKLEHKVGLAAATQYMSGSSGRDISAVVGEGPQQVIDRSAMMSHLDRNQAALLSNLTTTRKRAAKDSRDGRKAASSAKRTADRLGGQKRDAEKSVSKVKSKLNQMRRKAAANSQPDPTQPPSSGSDGGDKAPPVSGSGKGADAVREAKSQIGKPYVWGASGPSSFDCSGLTMWAYNKVGVSIPHYTVDQYEAAKSHPSMGEAKPGDLVFFGSDKHHVGMFVGGGKMVEAPYTGANVRISSVSARSDVSGLGRYTG